MGILELMAAPFAECLVLVGIHTYLGVHVLRRRVIFVDLALAQIAALGATVGFLFGILPESSAALIFSMAFTFVGAAVFAVTRIKSERVPQEAVIGLVYAISCAVAILVIEKTQGAEHLKDILVGSLLWVKWTDVGTAAVAYAAIGAVHYALRKQFLLISENPDEAYQRGLRVRLWDFLFYVTFGFVITFSTRVAGVLLVFVFLVAPAIMAFLVTDRLRNQLILGWVMGTVVTVVGLYLSYVWDLPSGPTVIAAYGVALAAGAMLVAIVRSRAPSKTLASIGVGSAIAVAVALVFYVGGHWLASTPLSVSEEARRVEASVAQDAARTRSRAEAELDRRVAELAGVTGGCSGRTELEEYASLPDADAAMQLVETRREQDATASLRMLLFLLADPETPVFYRSEGAELLESIAGQRFGYDPNRAPAQNAEALERICRATRLASGQSDAGVPTGVPMSRGM